MPHPNIVNSLPFACEPLHLRDGEGRPIMAVVIKATLDLRRNAQIAENQVPILLAGQFNGPPESSSYQYEPENAFFKPSTDIALIGHAHATQRDQKQTDVRLQVGDLKKTVRVFGDRTWVRSLGVVDKTAPQPFETIPLVYERAFGGWELADPDPATSRFEARNPVGVGFKRRDFDDGLPVPNLEDPKRLIQRYGETPPPAGFGFISPNWRPRASYAGTYDEKWQSERAPLLPLDFDPRFFNAAAPGLIAPEYLRGDESICVENGTPDGRLEFQLPRIRPPTFSVHLRNGKDTHVDTQLDTVIINTDDMVAFLLWRNHIVLRNGPHDIATLVVGNDEG